MARRCLVEGCGYFVKAGKVVSEEVTALARELGELAEAGDDAGSRREAVREFRRRVERGEDAALFAGRLREAVGEASQGAGFEDERAALRAALWRVMGEEGADAVRLAHAVSRLVGTTVRAARAEERARRAGGVESERERLAALLELLGGE
jgi:hypothetical protein